MRSKLQQLREWANAKKGQRSAAFSELRDAHTQNEQVKQNLDDLSARLDRLVERMRARETNTPIPALPPHPKSG